MLLALASSSSIATWAIWQKHPVIWGTVIFFTGQDTAECRQKALDVGGDDFIVKPVELETLIEKMSAHLN